MLVEQIMAKHKNTLLILSIKEAKEIYKCDGSVVHSELRIPNSALIFLLCLGAKEKYDNR